MATAVLVAYDLPGWNSVLSPGTVGRISKQNHSCCSARTSYRGELGRSLEQKILQHWELWIRVSLVQVS